MKLLKLFGLSPSEQDQKLKQLVDNSYDSVRVVGRGTVKIDPEEVGNTREFKAARRKAKKIVRGA
jgi:hypothetical protein